jgi:hypothetical protein
VLRGMSWVLRALLLLLLSIRGKPLLLPPTSSQQHYNELLRVGFTDRQARLVLRKVRPSDVSGLLRQLFGGGSSGDGENEEDGEGGFLTREQAIYLCTAYPTALLAPPASEASRRWCWHRKYWAVCGAGFDRCLCGARPSSSLFSSSSLLLSSTLTASLPPPLTPVAGAVLSIDSEFSPWRIAIVASLPSASGPQEQQEQQQQQQQQQPLVEPVLLLDALIVQSRPTNDAKGASLSGPDADNATDTARWLRRQLKPAPPGLQRVLAGDLMATAPAPSLLLPGQQEPPQSTSSEGLVVNPQRIATAEEVRSLLRAWLACDDGGKETGEGEREEFGGCEGGGTVLVGHTVREDLLRLFGSDAALQEALPAGCIVDVASLTPPTTTTTTTTTMTTTVVAMTVAEGGGGGVGEYPFERPPRRQRQRQRQRARQRVRQRLPPEGSNGGGDGGDGGGGGGGGGGAVGGESRSSGQPRRVLSLREQAKRTLAVDIQDPRLRHCPVEDALAALTIYQHHQRTNHQ